MKAYNAAFDKINALTDNYRLSVLLGKHPDTAFRDVANITSRVGQENMDRFFMFSLPRLNVLGQSDPALQAQIDTVLKMYNRDVSGYTVYPSKP